MEFEKVKPLLSNSTIAVFENDSKLFASYKKIADQIVLDESGYIADDVTDNWLLEPYAYILSKLALNKMQNVSEEKTNYIVADYKRAIEVLRAKKDKPVIGAKFTRGTVEGNVW